ncbi:DUF551 domain-containing protein [Pantoea sp. V106_11]|uniref:DUF551 domain-containing protein n=1 Tax=Pantoea sp. V106_11 TaxID=3044234 RepID=UPI00249F68A4|nr:DUF551 domain-containing protein [Pantoea sp. V106_11]MDI3415681.1 DUF551 domain-containing protein [Pantoea sp. V106_11]
MISERMKRRIEEMPDAQLIDWICLYCVDVRGTHSDDDAQEFINDIRQALEMRLNATAQPVSDGWVKCSDRMPDNEDYYLTYSNSGVDVEYFDGRVFSDKKSTHWMPLPAAPGGQDE